jgi:hypothetical protein
VIAKNTKINTYLLLRTKGFFYWLIEMLVVILLYKDVICTDYGNMWQNWASSERVTSDESEEI